MDAANLTRLINQSIRTHEAQHCGIGVPDRAVDTLSGIGYSLYQEIREQHGKFATMLRGIITRNQSAGEIIESLENLIAERSAALYNLVDGHNIATTAFISELGAIIASAHDDEPLPTPAPSVVGHTLAERLTHATSVHEASGESATMLRMVYLEDGLPDETIIGQLRDLQSEIRANITRFLSKPNRGIRRAEARSLLAEIDAIIDGPESTVGEDADFADEEFSVEEVIEDRAVREAGRLLQEASPMQSTPWIARLADDVARASVAIALQSR